ncbi:MAG: DUF3108 domain-containing protein [Gammaproteobacteria bacterium]
MTNAPRQYGLKPLLILIFACSSHLVSAGDRPTPFIAVYDVHHSGARVAETTVMLTRINRDSYSLSSTTHPRGFASLLRKTPVIEHSRFEFTEYNHMHGIAYEFDDGSSSGKRNRSISFDWDAGKAVSKYKDETYEIELSQPVGDRLAMQALLMRDLGEESLRDSYRLLDRDAIKTYLYTPLGEELLDTPAGRFNTVKIKQQREGSSRMYHIWLAREHDFAIVKMAQFKNDKPRTVLTATRVQSGVADTLNYGSTPPGDSNSIKVINVTKSGPVLPTPPEDVER